MWEIIRNTRRKEPRVSFTSSAVTSGLGFERFLGVEAENGCIKSATHLLPVTFNQRVDGKILRLRAAIGSTTSPTGRIHHRRCTTTKTTIKPSASFRIVLSQDSGSVIIHASAESDALCNFHSINCWQTRSWEANPRTQSLPSPPTSSARLARLQNRIAS